MLISTSTFHLPPLSLKLTFRGEELGLPEVLDIPDDQKQDPMFFNTNGKLVGRDGCRVPIPWTSSGSSFGFGPEGSKAHLPQPDWMAEFSVEKEAQDASSTLNFYRKALALRRELQGAEELEWVTEEQDVLHFARPGGWEVVLNLSDKAIPVPEGQVLLSSASVKGGQIGTDVCVWIKK